MTLLLSAATLLSVAALALLVLLGTGSECQVWHDGKSRQYFFIDVLDQEQIAYVQDHYPSAVVCQYITPTSRMKELRRNFLEYQRRYEDLWGTPVSDEFLLKDVVYVHKALLDAAQEGGALWNV